MAVCRLAALALKINIHIQRLLRLNVGPIVLPGGLPTPGESRPTVRLLIQENNLPIYDDHFVQIGVSEGHFWFEDRPTAAPGGQVLADGPAKGPDPTHPVSLANGTDCFIIQPGSCASNSLAQNSAKPQEHSQFAILQLEVAQFILWFV